MAAPTLLLSQNDVSRCIDLKEVVDIVRRVYRAHGEGEVVLPPKITLDLEPVGYEFWSNAMPAYVAPFGAVGMKWAGGLLNNPSRYGLPYLMGTILLQNPENGLLLSVMDGALITSLRTGAAAAVCASYVARNGASRVAIIGAGIQGRASLQAISYVLPIEGAGVADAMPSAAERCAVQMSEMLGRPVRACSSVMEAVDGADVVVTATPASQPIVSDDWLKPGVAAISLGSFQEYDDDFVLGVDRIVVDNVDQCMHRGVLASLFERGKMAREDIDVLVGDIAAGRDRGRGSDTERVLAVPVGMGSLDLAVASVVYKRAVEMGLGAQFSFL